MDILTVNYEWPAVTDNCGGGGRIGKVLTDGLRARGHNVTVVTDDADGHYATFPVRCYRKIRHEITSLDPDVIHGQFSIPTSIPLARLASKFDVPYVVTPMGADVYDPTRYELIRPATRHVNRRIFDRSAAVTPPSTDLAERMVSGDYDSDVIHYGIDPNDWEWRERQRNGPLNILTVCRLVERKNLDVAADTVQRYRRQHGAAKWRVVGKGPLADEVSNNDVADWRGYVDDLQAEFDWADVFFLPSKHEAFGIVFLEALAAGLPVVTSDCGGQTDIIAHGAVGLYTTPEPKALAAALQSIDSEYSWFQSNTRNYVRDNFNQESMVDAYERTFEAVA